MKPITTKSDHTRREYDDATAWAPNVMSARTRVSGFLQQDTDSVRVATQLRENHP